MTPPRVYLDHAATTALRPEAAAAMAAASGMPANPSSIHAEGRAARAVLDRARSRIAFACGARGSEIVFTGGGSEANNLAISGTAYARRDRGRHLVTTAIEHSAVLRTCEALRDEGWELTILPVDGEGFVDVADFRDALRPDTVLASVMAANNEIGTVEPIEELAALARERGVTFHTDAVQAVGALALPCLADLTTFSAHKFGGPAGVGILVARGATPLVPLVFGGGQERGRRSGTENVAAIAAAAEAFVLAEAEREAMAARTSRLRDRLESAVASAVAEALAVGPRERRLPGLASIAFADVAADALVIRLDLDGIAVSAGSACSTGALEPSHVLEAIGLPGRFALGTIRFSLGRTTTAEEIDRTVTSVVRAVTEIRARDSAAV